MTLKTEVSHVDEDGYKAEWRTLVQLQRARLNNINTSYMEENCMSGQGITASSLQL